MKVDSEGRVVTLSRENIERLIYMLDHPEEHGESWCGKRTDDGWWIVRAEENAVSAPDPRDVLREVCADTRSKRPSWVIEQSLADVDALVEAARDVTRHDHIGECGDHAEHLMAAEHDIRALRAALARFAGDRNPPA